MDFIFVLYAYAVFQLSRQLEHYITDPFAANRRHFYFYLLPTPDHRNTQALLHTNIRFNAPNSSQYNARGPQFKPSTDPRNSGVSIFEFYNIPIFGIVLPIKSKTEVLIKVHYNIPSALKLDCSYQQRTHRSRKK
jgi:hypothetical protein